MSRRCWRACRFALVSVCFAVTLNPFTDSFADEKRSLDQKALDRLLSLPLGLPKVSLPGDNQPTIEKISLGRKLFFDRRLSKNGTMSCGMCHIPEQGFTNNELATPIGVHGESVKRNAPTILNTAYQRRLFLDGRAATLEDQAVMPLLADNEMGNESEQVLLGKIAELEDYDGLFEAAFSGGATLSRIGNAIASWERTLLAANAPFDRWRYRHEKTLSPSQKRGLELFQGKARCIQCHPIGAETALFTDQAFHDTGIGYLRSRKSKQDRGMVRVEIAPGTFVSVERSFVAQVEEAPLVDLGRFEFTARRQDQWRYRTPSLRNVAVTAPYMHDGSLPTLESVVQHYNRGGAPHPGQDPRIQPLGLTDDQVHCIVAFLNSLTAGNLAALIFDARSGGLGIE